jgi:hypothetical protein
MSSSARHTSELATVRSARTAAAEPPPLSRILSDLVLDSKLDTTVLENGCIQHKFTSPGRSAGERYVRVEERWRRERTLGEGAHGIVYRERLEGQATARLRAVKKMKKIAFAELDYSRELEASVKFSHPKVRFFFFFFFLSSPFLHSICTFMRPLGRRPCPGHLSAAKAISLNSTLTASSLPTGGLRSTIPFLSRWNTSR